MNPGRQVFVLHYQYSTVTLQQQTMVHHTRILGRAVGGGQTIARGPSNALCVKLRLLKIFNIYVNVPTSQGRNGSLFGYLVPN